MQSVLGVLKYRWPSGNLYTIRRIQTPHQLIIGTRIAENCASKSPFTFSWNQGQMRLQNLNNLLSTKTMMTVKVLRTQLCITPLQVTTVVFLLLRMKKLANLNQDTVIWNPLIIRWNKRLLTSASKVFYWSSSELPCALYAKHVQCESCCKQAMLSACIAKCMTTIKKIFILTFCYCKNKLTSVFQPSVLLLTINFVITLSK